MGFKTEILWCKIIEEPLANHMIKPLPLVYIFLFLLEYLRGAYVRFGVEYLCCSCLNFDGIKICIDGLVSL